MSSALQALPSPDDELRRLAALDSFDILDTPREKDFDDVAELASAICGTPIGVVNLIAEGRQFFKAEVGLGVRETPLETSFCARAILEEEFLLVPDATKDPRFQGNPLVTGEPHLRFYAGALLRTEEGAAIGTVCVLDYQPRILSDLQTQAVRVLARQVMRQLELRRALAKQRADKAALRVAETRYTALFNALDAGFCIIRMAFDPEMRPVDYRFEEVNDAFARQTGLENVAGKWMRDVAPGHEQHWFDTYGRVALTGEPVRFENAAEELDDRWYDVRAYRVGEPNDRLVAVLFNDISERRRTEVALSTSEARLQELNATLEARVEERTRDLLAAEEALRQSQKLEAVGQLTGGVAHDFNNLLTVIRSSVDLLGRPNLPEDRRRRYIEAISDTVTRAAKLTGQLLAFARRQALKPEVFDAGRSVDAIGDVVRTLTGSRIRIVNHVSAQPCFVSADPSQFDTALVNMAVNARDAMDGEGVLTITVKPVTLIPPIRAHAGIDGDFVAVSVADTGIGISSDQIERIFEPFYTTKGVGQGTGLGLSQVFGFAKQSGGDIAVESEVGKGATFTIYLPRIADHVAEAASSGGALADTLDGAGTCVLVVEDNQQVGDFCSQTLAELGYGTQWVSNAQEALETLAKDPRAYDVVFSDIVMPGMNGIELGREIRRLYPDLPVVLASGYSHVLAEEGTHGFELLQKPYSVESLSRVLQGAVALRRRNG